MNIQSLFYTSLLNEISCCYQLFTLATRIHALTVIPKKEELVNTRTKSFLKKNFHRIGLISDDLTF